MKKDQNFDIDYDAPTIIKIINFEPDCLCESFGDASFCHCPNLETVIFPPHFVGNDSVLFGICPKLHVLDLSNVKTPIDKTAAENLISAQGTSKTGQIIIKGETNREAAEQIQKRLGTG